MAVLVQMAKIMVAKPLTNPIGDIYTYGSIATTALIFFILKMDVKIFFAHHASSWLNLKRIRTINLCGIEPNPCLPLSSALLLAS